MDEKQEVTQRGITLEGRNKMGERCWRSVESKLIERKGEKVSEKFLESDRVTN